MVKCYECETTEDLQEHHVVPRSRGGTKTVTLCYQCHMKAHGRSGKGQDHRELTKQGMKKALEKKRELSPDYKFGNPRWEDSIHKAKAKQIDEADKRALRWKPIITKLYSELGSYTKVANELNKQGIETERGNKWSPTTVRDIWLRLNGTTRIREEKTNKKT
tara:strand:+ start:70 stop:555 length:486 start_codon:yes stop_codon:yes gene_type:complete